MGHLPGRCADRVAKRSSFCNTRPDLLGLPLDRCSRSPDLSGRPPGYWHGNLRSRRSRWGRELEKVPAHRTTAHHDSGKIEPDIDGYWDPARLRITILAVR